MCFLRSAISTSQPEAEMFIQHHQCLIGVLSHGAADIVKWNCCFAFLLCSLTRKGIKWKADQECNPFALDLLWTSGQFCCLDLTLSAPAVGASN